MLEKKVCTKSFGPSSNSDILAFSPRQLADVEVWESRVKALERMLGAEQWDPESEKQADTDDSSSEAAVRVEDADEVASLSALSENGSEAVDITESMLREE